MDDIYEPLDDGIADVVMLLRRNGINTFASCEGGRGHAFNMPTILIRPSDAQYMDEDEIKIAKILSDGGYSGYFIKLCHAYQGKRYPWNQSQFHSIEIEFWIKPVMPEFGTEDISPIGKL